MLQHIGNLAEHQPGFAHVAFKPAFSQVPLEGFIDRRFPRQDAGLQLFQGLYSVIDIQSSPGVKKGRCWLTIFLISVSVI